MEMLDHAFRIRRGILQATTPLGGPIKDLLSLFHGQNLQVNQLNNQHLDQRRDRDRDILFAESGSFHIDSLSRRRRPFEGTLSSPSVRGTDTNKPRDLKFLLNGMRRFACGPAASARTCSAMRALLADDGHPASDGVSVRRIADLTRCRSWRRANGRWNAYP